MSSKSIIQNIITAPTVWRFLKAQYYDTYVFLNGGLPKLEPATLFSFTDANDLKNIWDVSTNDCHPYTGQLNNCTLKHNPLGQYAHFYGKIVPNVKSEDELFKYGYCNLKTRIVNLGSFQAYPTMDLDLYGRLEIVYHGDYDNPAFNSTIPFNTKCIFNIYTKSSIISLPSIFQCGFEILPGWNKLTVPFNNGALKYVKNSWYDMKKLFEPDKICMLSFGFASRDVESQFNFKLKSITAIPNVDSRGMMVNDYTFERDAEPHFQVPLQDVTLVERAVDKRKEKKRATEIY